MKRRSSVPTVGFLLLSLAACDDYEAKGWLINRTRVLGARVEAVSDPSRASLASGERAKITWLIANPDAPPRLSWSYAACLPPGGNFPEPHCLGPALTSGSGTSDGELVPMDFETPPLAATGDATKLLVLAAFCQNGAPTLDPRSFTATCAGGGDALLASVNVLLEKGGTNHNPVITDDAVRLDAAQLPPTAFSVAPGPCTGSPDAPVVQAGVEDMKVYYRFRDDDREVVPEGREELLLTSVVTSGELDRQYSSFDMGESGPKEVNLEFTAPGRDQVGAGRTTRLYFILRDGRGGMSFAVRSVCIRP